jgi:hypothetical protein
MVKSAASLLRETPFPVEAAQATRSRMRPTLLTIPCDLEEYARVHTGPSSWSADIDDVFESGVFESAAPASAESLEDLFAEGSEG